MESAEDVLECPHCERQFLVTPAVLGKKIRCRGCRMPFRIPAGIPAAEDIGDVLEDADSNEQCPVATVSRSYGKAAGTEAGDVADSLVGVRQGSVAYRADAARGGALAGP